ncbi:MAG: hypothetical protein ACJAT9_001107 [Polaribacter sp.]|jgi:hypothetical protein|tara:strand:+ start:2524 stop:3429 length:906 start_codon:yes stop_codon:yes gene_type:complete
MINYIKRKDLEVVKYNACIENAMQSRVSAFSWYLDIVADNWDVLVMNDYKAVMPIPWRKKFGIKYIYPPLWLIQLGIYSIEKENEDAFLKMLLSNFRFFETRTNSKNYFSVFKEYQQKRDIQVLDLKQPYETMLSRFRRDRKKDLRKAKRSELNMKIENNLDKFINLYKLNVGKKVKKIKEIDYNNLKLLITACIDKKKGEILSVYDGEGNLVAAGFFLKDKERVVKLVSSTDYNNRKNGANTFLIEKAVRKYYEAFDLFDFGGSSVKSIASFNLSFGAHTENYLQLKYNGLPKILKIFKK